jgi:hypothetical protein
MLRVYSICFDTLNFWQTRHWVRHTVQSRAQFCSNDHQIRSRRILLHAREFVINCTDRRHPDANVFRRLQQSLQQTLSVGSTHLQMEAAHDLYKHQTKRRHNCTREAIALERFKRNWNRIGLSKRGSVKHFLTINSIHNNYCWSAHLFAEDIPLWMQFFWRLHTITVGGRDSSVGMATRYGLDGPGIETPVGARFSAPVHTGTGGPPSLLSNGYSVFTGGGKAAGAWRWPPTPI